jgi:hypothetical protein
MDDREYDFRKGFYIESMRMMSAFSAKGINVLFLAGMGACAGLLIFMTKLDTFRQTPGAFAFLIPLAMFFLSAVLASATFCLSYIAQFFYTGNAFTGKFSFAGALFHLLAVLSMITAYAACLYGMWRVYLIFMRP